MFLFFIGILVFKSLKICNGCMATPANVAEVDIPIVEPLACSTCPALPLLQAPNVPSIENGLGAVTEGVNGAGCKSYTVSCQATEGTPPVGIGGIRNGEIIVAAGPTPGPITVELVCNAEAMIQGTDVTGAVVTFNSVYCVQAEVTALCSTCTLPLLPAPMGPDFENAMGTVTMDVVGGCTRFTVTCEATDGDPDIAFGESFLYFLEQKKGMRNGMNILVAGPAKGPITRQFICNNDGIVQGPNSMGAAVEFDSVYCSQTL